MDPLSITTSVITLVETTGKIYKIIRSYRNADKDCQALVQEVQLLFGRLKAIRKALEDIRAMPSALDHISQTFWDESRTALADCKETLNALLLIVNGLHHSARSSTLLRRTRLMTQMRTRREDVSACRGRISFLDKSLQTLLQVINISLSLRMNASHDSIQRELRQLKDNLVNSSQNATTQYSTLFIDEKDRRLVNHLNGLIHAATDFHATASTTASTVHGDNSIQEPSLNFDSVSSPLLPSVKRQRVEDFVRRIGTQTCSGGSIQATPLMASATLDSSLDLTRRGNGPAAETTFDSIFFEGFSKTALKALQDCDFQKAEGLLKQALKMSVSSFTDDSRHHRLRTQLAFCSLLQGDLAEAQKLILQLVPADMNGYVGGGQLLYALTLSQIHNLEFESAEKSCALLWQYLPEETSGLSPHKHDAMTLLETTMRHSGNVTHADAIEAEFPGLLFSELVPRPVDFLAQCDELLLQVFGLEGAFGSFRSGLPGGA